MAKNPNDIYCAIVILAAGSSSRLGEPKQLLPFNGKSLLSQAALTALSTGLKPVVVVLGENNEAMKKELEGMDLAIAENKNWQHGMSTSLQCGLDKARQLQPELNAVIFMVCDQPFVTPALLQQLVKTQAETGKWIVASSYQDTLGTPALFTQRVFPALSELAGDAGARKLIKKYGHDVATVDFPKGHIDIDTKEDYESFIHPMQWKKN
jgi:molybdenum cofactor cytidylyltransferase